MDATTMSLSKDSLLPKRVPILQSHGADAACILNATNGGENQSSFVGITFPDGTTCLFSSIQDEFDAVGIAEADHQLLLSYPAIGKGQIDIAENNGSFSTYLATCLRGGTCYLIPTSPTNDDNASSIPTIPFPHDIESDLSDIYVQSFTAGNLVVDDKKVPLPVLVYAWPGGVIDVYACGLEDLKVPNNTEAPSEIIDDDTQDVFVSRMERRCLRDLIDNESLLLFSQIIDEMREDSRNPVKEEWQGFLMETKNGKMLSVPVEDITLDSLCSARYQNLRRVLLSLALVIE